MAYAVMLLDFPQSDVMNFWEKNRLVRTKRSLSAKETLLCLWDHKNRVPLRYLLQTMANIDALLEALPDERWRQFEATLLKVSHAMPLMPNAFLEFAAPILHVFFKFRDPRYAFCSRIVEKNQMFMMPDSFYRYYDRIKDKNGFSGYAAISYNPSFDKLYPAINVWRWVVLFLANGCQTVGLPAIDEIAVRADMRPPAKALSNRAVEVCEDGKVFLDGKEAGQKISFKAFCRKHGFNLRDIDPPDTDVLAVEVDGRGPCALGAPLYLLDFKCSRVAESRLPENPMQSLIRLGANWVSRSWRDLEKLHVKFLEGLKDEYAVSLDQQREILTVNGRTVARNISALLIGGIIRCYCIDGKNSFSKRDILSLPEVKSMISDSGYNIYVQRACRYMSRYAPSLTFVRQVGQGIVSVQAACTVRFGEKN
jgi:hypothetical protein